MGDKKEGMGQVAVSCKLEARSLRGKELGRQRFSVSGFLLALLLILTLSFAGANFIQKEGYVVGENLRVDLSDYVDYELRIDTPSNVFLKEGTEDTFLFELIEIGEYKFTIQSEGRKEINYFEVFETEEEVETARVKSLEQDVTLTYPIDPVENISEDEEVNGLLEENTNITTRGVTKKNENTSNSIVSQLNVQSLKEIDEIGEEGALVVIGVIRVGENVRWSEWVNTSSGNVLIPYAASNVSFVQNGSLVGAGADVNIYNKVVSVFSKEVAKREVVLNESLGKVRIEYETPAPEISEKELGEKAKEVVVSAPDYLGYKNVYTSTKINEYAKDKKEIKLNWVEENQSLDFEVNDTDGNGFIDEIYFVVPHLSTQTFEIIIINAAEHLDSERNFIKNIYEEVRERDNIFVAIPAGEYIRVVFEKLLDSSKDITIYAKSDEGASVEVYEKDSDVLIADFGIIKEDKKYQIFLKELVGDQNTFDLLVKEGSVYFDYVVDPTAAYNPGFGAPYCSISDSPCVAPTTLLIAEEGMGGTSEPNNPNTVDSCIDGTSDGTYLTDENIENITITSLNGSSIEDGDTVRVDVWAYCYNNANDNLNLIYANDASSISWTIIDSVGTCPVNGGFYLFSSDFVLTGSSGDHVVRGIIQYNGDVTNTCGDVQTWSDTDDVVFRVDEQSSSAQVNEIQCEESGSWKNCNEIDFGETITQVRVNCTSIGGAISEANFELLNTPDSNVFFNSNSTSNAGDFWTYDNSDVLIDDSGDFVLNITCFDDVPLPSPGESTWFVDWGVLTSELVVPNQNETVAQNNLFTFTSNVICMGGECGYVNATLDPLENWWNSSWGFRKEINVTNVGASILTNFPIYLELPIESQMGSNLDDLRFVDGACQTGGGSEVDFEIESYNSTFANVWLRVPNFYSGINSICMYYDNSNAVNRGNAAGVWNSNYMTVQHLEEASGTGDFLLDSTGNGNNGAPLGTTPTYLASAKVASGYDLGGNNQQRIEVPDSTDLQKQVFTAEGWAKADTWTTPDHNPILWKGSQLGWGANYLFRIAVSAGAPTFGVTCGGTEGYFAGGAVNLGEWYHYALTFDGTTATAYIDGQSVATSTTCSGQALNVISGEPLRSGFGYRSTAVEETHLDGQVDELRFSDTPRSADWINESYQLIQNQNNLVLYGEASENFKGIIPMNTGVPFYTTSQNPVNYIDTACLADMKDGDSCVNSWIVNATGGLDSSWEFFTIYDSINYSSYVNTTQTPSINLTISTTTSFGNSVINSIDCEENSIWKNCSDINYGEVITRVRANCTSNKGSVVGVNFELLNIPDSSTIFNVNSTSNVSDYWIRDNLNWVVEDSGDFALNIECYDNGSHVDYGSSNWFIPWGTLSSYFVSPSTSASVLQNDFFNITSRVTCSGGECGDINATLDPELIWWNSSWVLRKEINITNGGVSSLIDFPVHLKLPVESEMQTDLADLRFVNGSCSSEGGVEMDFEIENYDTLYADVWVRAPLFSAGVNSICMYYNNSLAVSGEDVSRVWDSNHLGVWHLNGTTGTKYDSTINANDAVNSGAVETTGKIGLAQEFDGADVIEVPRTIDLEPTSAITVSLWLKRNGAQVDYAKPLWYGPNDNSPWGAYGFELNAGSDTDLMWHVASTTTATSSATYTMADGTWYLLTGTYNGTHAMYYVDGVLFSTVAHTGGIADYDGIDGLAIGDMTDGGQGYVGTIDEVTISGISRSADWINQTYQLIENQANLISIGNFERWADVNSKGIVPMNSGVPFYTIMQNPLSPLNLPCLSGMKGGDYCNSKWAVNATGPLYSIWEFFVIYNPVNYALDVVLDETNKINIAIADFIISDFSLRAQVQAESGFGYVSGTQTNITLENNYYVNHAFMIVDSQISASTNTAPNNADGMFYFSNITGGYSNQLTIERIGTTDSMVGSYSLLETEYIDTCHVEGIVGNGIDKLNISLASACAFMPSNYKDKCFVSVRNNVMSSSSDASCRGEGLFMGKFESQNILSVQANTRACGNREVRADVVCFNDNSRVTNISTGEVHLDTGVDFDIGKSVNLNNSFLIHSCRSEEYGIEDVNIQCKFKDSSTVTCLTSELGTGGTAPQECEIYVVEFEEGVYSSAIHHTPTDLEIGDNTIFNSTLPSQIDLNASSLFCSYSFLNGEGTASSRGEYPAFYYDNTTIQFERGRTGNTDPSHNINCEVVTWPTRKDAIQISLVSPENNYAEYDLDPANLTFVANVEAKANLKECNLVHSASGSLQLGETKSVSGKSATVQFTLTNLSNVSFDWNIRCENIIGEMSYARNNRFVTVKKLSAPVIEVVSPFGQINSSPVVFAVQSNVTIENCTYSLNSGPPVLMTQINTTFYSASDDYVRNGANYVNFSCLGENGRAGINSSNFNIVTTFSPEVVKGRTIIANGESETVIPLTTDYLANAFLLFSIRSSTSTPAQIQIEGVLNKNNITFSRYSTSGVVNIDWQVIESSNIFVRRGISPFLASDSAVTAFTENFNLSKSFIISSNKLSSTDTAENVYGFFNSKFSNTSYLNFERSQVGAFGEIAWQAIEWSGSKVQVGATTFSGSSGTVSLSKSVDTSTAFLITSNSFDSGATGLDELNVRSTLFSNKIDFNRTGTTGDSTVSWFVVESLEIGVQNGTRSISGSSAINQPISSVNSSKAFSLESHDSTGGGTTFANSALTNYLTSDTNLEFYKGTGDQTNDAFWQVIEMGVPINSFVILDTPQNESYNSSDVDFKVNTKLASVSCKYSLDFAANVSMTLVTPTSFVNSVYGLAEGNHTAVFYCVDPSSVEYVSDLVEFNIDLTNPGIILDAPIDHYNTTSNTIDFGFIADDNYGIKECSLFLDSEISGANYNILNDTVENIQTFVSNGIHDWFVSCLDYSNREVISSSRQINVTGEYSIDWNNRLYESSTSNFVGNVAQINLKNKRDLIENYLSINLSGSSVTDFVIPMTTYLGNNGMRIPTGATVSFSSYTEVDTVNAVYLTWKLYFENSSGDNLICQSGNDYTGGLRVSATSGVWTSNCIVPNEFILKNSDKIKLVISGYNDNVGNVTLIHRWDGLKASFVEFSDFSLIGQLYTDFLYPVNDKVMTEAEEDNFTCQVNCSIGECVNVDLTLQYLNDSVWVNVHNNNEHLIFGDGYEWRDLGTINYGSVSEDIPVMAISPGNAILRCYARYDYGNAFGFLMPTVDVIKVPRASYINPTPVNGIEVPQDFIPINISVNETDLNTVILDFNGVNQTLFNSLIMLGYNLDREEFRGENDTHVSSFVGGIDGTIYGANYTTGYEGLALSFDGVNDYIQTDVSLTPVLGSTSSLSFWVKTTQVGDDTMWMAPGVTGIEEAGGGNDIFIGWLDATGHIGYTVANSAAVKSTVPINDGTWKHIVISRYANNGSSKIYINGELNQQAISYIGNVTNNFYSFGRIEDTGGTPEYFNGSFDKFVVYDRVISDEEAKELYTGQRTFFVNETSLINDDYMFTTYAENYYGGVRQITRTVSTKFGDVVAPQLVITGIENEGAYTTGNFNIDVYLDEYGNSCSYVLDSASSVSMNRVNDTHFDMTLNSVSEGNHIIAFSCRDSSNNENLTIYNFAIDTINPSLVFGSLTPADSSDHLPDGLIIDVDLTEANLEEVVLDFNGTNNFIYDGSLIGLIGLDNLATFSENSNNIYDYVSGALGDNNGASWISGEGHDGLGAYRFFRGDSDYIEIGAPYNFVSKNITILSWVKTSSIVNEESILSIDDSAGNTLLSIGHAAGSNFLSVADSYGRTISNSVLVDGDWHQIGFAFYEGKNISIIYDGEVVRTFSTTVTLPSDLKFNLGMGYNGITPSYFFDGYIDEVKIYDKILNSSELIIKNRTNFYKKDLDKYYFNIEFNNLTYGDYDYSVLARDSSDLIGTTGDRSITIRDMDTVGPVITLNLPIDSFTSSSSSVNFNFTVIDNTDDSMDCTLYVGDVSYSGITAPNNTLINYLVNSLGDGPKYWNVSCIDMDNNVEFSEQQVITIAESPTINLNDANNSYLTNSLEYTPNDNSNITSCSLIIGGVVFDTISSIVTDSQNIFDITSLSQGYFDYAVNCTDVYLLESISEDRFFYKDLTAPNLTLAYPLNNSEVYSGEVNFTFWFDDLYSSEAYCNLTIDDVIVNESILASEGVNVSFVHSLNSNNHTWGASCVDLGENYVSSLEYEFENFAAPQVAIDSPENNVWTNDTDVTFSYTVGDNSGLANCSLYVDSVFVSVDTNIENWVSNSFTETLTENNHNWSIECYNNLNLVGYSETSFLSIDSHVPNIITHHPTGGETFDWNNLKFNFTYIDNLDSVGNCEILINGFNESGVLASNNTVSESFVDVHDGDYSWSIRCGDEAGNSFETLEKSFTMTAPPVIDIVSPTNNTFDTNSSVNFTYIPKDGSGLTQCEMFFDGSSLGADVVIENNVENMFEVNGISEGNHYWNISCSDVDSNVAWVENSIFTRDVTPPFASLVAPVADAKVDANIDPLQFQWRPTDNLATAIQCDLLVDDIKVRNNIWAGNDSIGQSNVNGISVGNHNWSVECVDLTGNVNTSEIYNFSYGYPDFFVSAVTLNDSTPVEGKSILINATVSNIGIADASGVLVEFYSGYPATGFKIGERIIDLNVSDVLYVNYSYDTVIGLNELWVVVDGADSFTEGDENNNLGNENVSVGAWQFFYGNIESASELELADLENNSVINWFASASVFMSDKDSSVSWDSVLAFGYNNVSAYSVDDFLEVDSLLSMVDFPDSISALYLTAFVPNEVDSFSVFGRTLPAVPVTQSTSNNNFKTGILWDSSDDTNGEFDIAEAEDLIFVSKINKGAVGNYGTYDYELRVPAKLREYSGAGSEAVFYVELQ